MTDYKALCADLHAAFNTYAVCEEHHELLRRTRAALAQPAPEGPTDKKLMQHLFEGFRGPIEFLCDSGEEAQLMRRNHVKFARSVLARWGNL
jgi:hypothetical protein